MTLIVRDAGRGSHRVACVVLLLYNPTIQETRLFNSDGNRDGTQTLRETSSDLSRCSENTCRVANPEAARAY